MAGTHLTVTLDDAQARAGLERLSRLDTQTLMPRLGEYLQRSTKARFKTQIAPDGRTPWAQLKERYAQRKKYNHDKVLTLRGYLRSSIHYQIPNAQTVEVGSNQKYAAIHQFGGTIQKKARPATVHFGAGKTKNLFVKKKNAARHKQVTIDARPFLGLSETDRQEIVQITLAWLRQ